MKAIIVDGHLKSALAAVRSLGEHGISFSVGAERKTAMGLHSRYTKDTFVYTSPLVNKTKFVDDIIAEAERLGDKPLIYAFSDATFLPLMRHRIRVERVATLCIGDTPDIETAFNKKKTLNLAKELGITIPKTHILDDLDDIAALSKELVYPYIVKPQHSVAWKENVGYMGTVMFRHSPGDLMAYVSKVFTETGEMPLLQKYVGGVEYGVEFLCDKGKVRAHCVHKRIRSLHPLGGASVLKETVASTDIVKRMEQAATKLVKKLSWHGVIMVEFKVDERKEEPVLMEINGRFWGSLPLAVFAGVDFPYLYYRLATDLKADEEYQDYKVGVTSRHLLGDVKHLLTVFFANDPMRKTLYPSRAKALRNFFGEGVVRYDVLERNDLTPFFMEIIDIFARSLP